MSYQQRAFDKFFNDQYNMLLNDEWITVNFLQGTIQISLFRSWLVSVNIKKDAYDLIDLPLGYVHFKDEDAAVLFKLAWC